MSAGPALSRRRALAYGAATVGAATLLGFGAGEAGLRILRGHIEGGDRLDRGLTTYDPRLGWVLSPSWRGRHRRYEYDVGYATNALAFRGPEAAAREPAALWLGDSFTFGFGVNDGETFVDRLDAARAGGLRHVNLGVPGYSTDQEALLLERRLSTFDARFVGVVVYLGNDLIDNALAFPMQADTAKPYFVLRADGALAFNPAPAARKPPAEQGRSFGVRLFEMAGVAPGPLDRLLTSIETARWLDLERPAPPDDLEARIAPALDGQLALFAALVRRMVGLGRPLAVVLVASRRHLTAPESWAGRYQEAGRRRLRDLDLGAPIIDLAEGFRELPGASGLHYPYDGHFTAAGHAAAAEMIVRSGVLGG